MSPLIAGLGVPELVIILVVVLLLFGGTKLAGLGKSTGRALREFKEETKDLRGSKDDKNAAIEGETVDAEVVEEPNRDQRHHDQPRHTADAKLSDPRRDV